MRHGAELLSDVEEIGQAAIVSAGRQVIGTLARHHRGIRLAALVPSPEQCGGAVKIIASIEDPQVIGRSSSIWGWAAARRTATSSRRRVRRRSEPAASSIHPVVALGALTVRPSCGLLFSTASPRTTAQLCSLCSGATSSNNQPINPSAAASLPVAQLPRTPRRARSQGVYFSYPSLAVLPRRVKGATRQ